MLQPRTSLKIGQALQSIRSSNSVVCSVLQYVAVCCSVLQCVAECSSMERDYGVATVSRLRTGPRLVCIKALQKQGSYANET